MGLVGAMWDYLGLSGAIWAKLGLSGAYGALWASLGLAGAILALWGYLDYSGRLDAYCLLRLLLAVAGCLLLLLRSHSLSLSTPVSSAFPVPESTFCFLRFSASFSHGANGAFRFAAKSGFCDVVGFL